MTFHLCVHALTFGVKRKYGNVDVAFLVVKRLGGRLQIFLPLVSSGHGR